MTISVPAGKVDLEALLRERETKHALAAAKLVVQMKQRASARPKDLEDALRLEQAAADEG